MFPVLATKTWHPNKMPEVTYHAACTAPDKQSEEDYQRLLEDIKANGIRVPIRVMKDNTVISGRHRIKAAVAAGCPIPVEVLDITDAECWSLSRSELCHRNLTPARAASLYLDMKAREEKEIAKERKENESEEGEKPEKAEKPKKKEKSKKGKASAKEAKEAGVSQATMERMKKINEKGIPAIWKAIQAEDISALDAAFIVDFDHDTQRAALNLVKDKKAKTLKAAKDILDKEAKAAAGPQLKDAKGKVVPKGLVTVFEDREEFAVLKENVKELTGRFKKLLKRESAKHIPKELAKHLEDIALALDIYQPYAISDTEDGWVTKRTANK